MEKYAIVKQKHLYTNEKNIMYKGKVHYTLDNSCTTVRYKEYDTNADVCLHATANELKLQRVAEITTQIHFILGQTTTNEILSEFGKIEINIYTHKYIKKENIIAVEYDILLGNDVEDGYRIIWDIKEETL